MKRPFIPKRHGNATKEQIERIKPSRKPPRLTPTQILTIRQLFRTGTSQMQIARDFTAQGVPLTQAMVSYIVNYKRRWDVP